MKQRGLFDELTLLDEQEDELIEEDREFLKRVEVAMQLGTVERNSSGINQASLHDERGGGGTLA